MATDTRTPDRVSHILMLSTTARWEGELLAEEWVFWDSALMARQIGLG